MSPPPPPPPKILVGATGSVASIKVPQLVSLLRSSIPGAIVKVIGTEKAFAFFTATDLDPASAHPLPNGDPLSPAKVVYTDADEWDTWHARGDPILHVSLRDWADILVIAPLDANTMAKVANGLADNLLTCVIRAWDYRDDQAPAGCGSCAERLLKPVLFAPAMNTRMWDGPLTPLHLDTLVRVLKFELVPPVSKELMCGDTGMGAMAEPGVVVDYVREALARRRSS